MVDAQAKMLPAGDFVAGAIARIAGLIREQDLRPGDRLPSEAMLSHDLHVSRTVVREALRSLAAMRLVDLGAGKRPTVAELDDGSMSLMIRHGVFTDQIGIQQIYDARRTIEARTATLAALHRTDAEAGAILGHALAMEANLDRPDDVMAHDLAFHLAIARASRNPVFALVIGAFQGVMRETWPIGWKSRGSNEERRAMNRLHVSLAQAIEAGDPQAASSLMDRHFDESIRALLAAGLI